MSGGQIIIEPIGGPHAVLGPSPEPLPARGATTMLASGWPITRITDPATEAALMKLSKGFNGGSFPGYSLYPCVSPDGKLAIGYTSNGGMSFVYDLATLKRVRYPQVTIGGRARDLGEACQLRWDYSQPDRHILVAFLDGIGGVWEDADTAQGGLLPGCPADATSDDHQGNAERFLSFQSISGGYKGLYDLAKREVSPLRWPIGQQMNIADVFGDWARVEQAPDGQPSTNYFHRLSTGELVSTQVIHNRHGHYGWSWDAQGREVWVYPNNNDDGLYAFCPETGVLSFICNVRDLGYPNHHPATVWSRDGRGWILMTTYGNGGAEWSANQWLLIPLVDNAQFVVRLGHTQNYYPHPIPQPKPYFAEAHTSFDPACRALYTGINWMRNDPFVPCLDVYKLDLGADFWDRLNAETGTPTPEPDPETDPDPDPLPTPRRWKIRIPAIEIEIDSIEEV